MRCFGNTQKKLVRSEPGERPYYEGEQILHIAVSDICPDPLQARKIFELDKLRELSDSIAEFGVLTPLIVRRVGNYYQLIAGERRLRAAVMAGFTHVPCVLNHADSEKAAYISLIENLQRRDLDFFEEASGLARLISDYGITQEEAARRIGKSQSAVANKLRLLKFDGDIISRIRDAGLSERHARALLRLPTAEIVRAAVAYIADKGLSVVDTERYVDSLLAPPTAAPKGRRTPLIRDVRLFINTVQHAFKTITAGGIRAELEQTESSDGITLVIHLPKKE